jgi:hypothetical protein
MEEEEEEEKSDKKSKPLMNSERNASVYLGSERGRGSADIASAATAGGRASRMRPRS